MVKTERLTEESFRLGSESFGNYIEQYSIEEMLQNGVLVKVTAWVTPAMGFATNEVRVNAVITASLWRTIVTVPTSCQSWRSIRGRGNDILWIAAWALRLARERGADVARFRVFLPIADDDQCPEKSLRTERLEQGGRYWIVIGLCEELSFALP